MKKIVSILAIAITMPALATDITGSSDCDNTTLGTYSAPVDMEAKWTANTINLQWYDDANDSTPTNTMCTYNTTIALPTEPSKPGYNFAGWQLREQLFDLTTLAQYINGSGISALSRSVPIETFNDGNPECRGGGSFEDCDGADYVGLNNGEWKVSFVYGTVRGIAICSTQGVANPWYTNNNTFTSDHFATTLVDETGQENADKCWCKTTGFAGSNSSDYMGVTPSVWVYHGNHAPSDNCANDCAFGCAYSISSESDFRRAIYGNTQ